LIQWNGNKNHSSNYKNDTRSRINWKINLTYFLEETETFFHLYLNTIHNKEKMKHPGRLSWCFIVEKEWGCNLNYIKLPRKGKWCKLILFLWWEDCRGIRLHGAICWGMRDEIHRSYDTKFSFYRLPCFSLKSLICPILSKLL
jgi:hypothetical protein